MSVQWTAYQLVGLSVGWSKYQNKMKLKLWKIVIFLPNKKRSMKFKLF